MTRPLNLVQYADLAKKCCPLGTWNYISSGSEDETTKSYNRVAFSRWMLKPRMLSGCTSVDLSVSLFDQILPNPILLAPIGYQGFVHSDAEVASIRGANAAQSLMVVSTMSNCSLEEIASESIQPLWFQIYCMKDKGLTLSLVQRAEDAGYKALVITVDTPRLGRRERDLSMSGELMSQLLPGNLPKDIVQKLGTLSFKAIVDNLFDAAIDWSTVSWLRKQTKLPVILKGILTVEDAEKAIRLGADGIVVSNHGGRQLDCAPASLDVLPDIMKIARGRCKVLLDGGIRRGTDILKARALGADAVLIGRPFLWGLICHGIKGVEDILTILKDELEHAMVLCGQSSWEKIDDSLIAINQSISYFDCRKQTSYE
jgi:4-hydroxymandelate oxidase